MNFLVFDGETCNTPMVNGQLDVKNGQVYDLGGAVIDEYGNEQTRFSIINGDVFFGMKEQMKEAYYAEKIPAYMQGIWNGQHKVVNTWEMYRLFRDVCKEYNVQAVVAHNSNFDVQTLNATIRYQTKSRKRYFLPYGMKVIDSLALARKVFGNDEKYITFCKENGYMTNHVTPRPRFTAEALWRYLSKDNNFMESHTGLKDVEIEKEIFVKCLALLREQAIR